MPSSAASPPSAGASSSPISRCRVVMQLEALALRMRPRAPLEAADLGVRLCQDAAGSVYACYAVVFVPIAALALATFEIGVWLPTLILFWSKPWLDRT